MEHSRIFYFENGGKSEIYCGSADWMPRNLERRVEILFPIEDEKLKEKYKSFAKWLRNTYVFPIHLTVYIKNCEKVKLLNGKWVYGSFRWFENKEPYIRIPSKINAELYQQYNGEELYEQVISSLVHELSHYFQWVLDVEQDDKTSERQANYFRYRIIDKLNLNQ